MSDVARILEAVQQGDPKAAEELLPLVYDELRKLAAHKMAQQPAGQTLQATALVHEAWLKLVGSGRQHWEGRRHFFAAAAEAMRHILIDRARKRLASAILLLKISAPKRIGALKSGFPNLRTSTD